MLYSKARHLSILILAELFFAYQFVIRVSLGAIKDDIMNKWQIDATYFGMISGIYYVGYAGMQIPVGILLDKFGPRIVIAISAFTCAVGNLSFVYIDHPAFALCTRLLIGIGSISGFLGAAKVISMNSNIKNSSFIMSITFTVGYMGAIFGGKPLNLIMQHFGWENILFSFSLIGLLISVLLIIIKFDYKNETKSQGNIIDNLKQVVKNPKIIYVCLSAALMIGPMSGFAEVWASSYFHKIYGINSPDAAMLSSTIYLGLCIGGMIISYIADRYKIHYISCFISGIIMCLIFILILSRFTESYFALQIMMFLIGTFSGYQIIAFTITTSLTDKNYAGTVTSLTNMIIMFMGSIFHFAIGKVMDLSWSGEMIENIRIYNEQAYINSLMVLPITSIIGALGFLIIKKM